MWPTLIQGVTKSEARVDVEKKTLTFVCESNALRPTKKGKLLYQNIAMLVQNILMERDESHHQDQRKGRVQLSEPIIVVLCRMNTKSLELL